MLNLSKLGITIALGLTMSMALFTTGAFAQSVSSNSVSTSAHVATVAGVLQRMDNAVQTASAQPLWGNGGDGDVTCHWYRERIQTRTCSGDNGCFWHSTWVMGRTCTGGHQGYDGGGGYGNGGGYYGGGYHYGGGDD